MKVASITPVLLVLVGLLGFRGSSRHIPSPQAQAQPEPRVFASRRDDPRVVQDNQLLELLERVRLPKTVVNTNNQLHALRLWGQQAVFSEAYWSGPQLREYFLDDAAFRRAAGDTAAPLIQRKEGVLSVRAWQRDDVDHDFASAHANDVVATFAEVGLPASTRIVLRDGEGTVGELYTAAAESFHNQQLEYEWTLIGYARLGYPQRYWVNQFSERVTLQDVATEAMQQPWSYGVCVGTHRLEGLMLLDRLARESKTEFPASLALHIDGHLKKAVTLLAASQSPEGYWTRRWHEGNKALENDTSDLAERILATGHHLEWLALASEEMQPPREHVIRAAQWMATALREVKERTLAENYGPFSHAARALCLWRGAEAWPTWQRLQGSVSSHPSSDEL